MPTEIESINRLLELGGAVAEPKDQEGHDPLVIIPNGCKIENLSALYPPRYIKQTVQLTAAAAFVDYVNRFKRPETLIFAALGDDPPATVLAVFDYHTAAPDSAPARCAHLARFCLRPTPEWQTWLEADRQRKAQLTFAEWLEENAPLLESPNGAELLELVQTLHGHSEARFNNTFRLKDGAVKLSYDEDVVIRGTAGNTSKPGELELPAFITARLALFEGGEKQPITARLKVRLENRKLVLWFETVQLARVVCDCINATLADIGAKTELPVLRGKI